MLSAQYAYYAWLFDGEGCVYIKHGHRARVGRALTLSVAVTMTDTIALCALVRDFGGSLRLSSRRNLSKHLRQAYRWQISAQKAVVFLCAIRPYTLVKSAQVDVAFAFQQRIQHSGWCGRRGIGTEEYQVRLELANRLSQLNKIPVHGASSGILANSGNPAMGTAELNGSVDPKSVETRRQAGSSRLPEGIVQPSAN